ncbi:MAG: hypothetical protein MUF04_11535, partial [Akkermansiaceae bacterium]|nr:hypothetical protein [Akkermansiaceae bacterium]
MTGWRFVRRSLWHFRGAYPPVLACCALASMVLLGALVAGDSVRASLRRMAEERTGRVEVVLDGGGRWLRAALADDLAADGIAAAPVMLARAEV